MLEQAGKAGIMGAGSAAVPAAAASVPLDAAFSNGEKTFRRDAEKSDRDGRAPRIAGVGAARPDGERCVVLLVTRPLWRTPGERKSARGAFTEFS